MDIEQVGDPKFGISIYKTSLKEHLSAIIECELSTSTHHYFKWNPATVGYHETPSPDYRKCWDCKIGKEHLGQMPPDLENVYTEVLGVITECVNDYTAKQNISPMQYVEAINFVKYGVGEHFAPHNDHGQTYVCAVSTVTYLNDNYEGGDIEFTKLGMRIKPKPGDVLVFPSNYIYTHSSIPVTNGVKYSAVTMFDYTDKWHKFHSAEPPVTTKAPQNSKPTTDMLCGGFEAGPSASNPA